MIPVRERNHGVTFQVKIQPRAKKNAISGEVGEALKLAVSAPAIEGRANQACIEFFAKLLKVPRSSVTIATGERDRLKVVQIAGLTAAQFRQRLPFK